MVEKIRKNILEIPPGVLKRVGLHSGDYVEVTDDGYHIILTPVEEEFSEEEWGKIEAIKKEKGRSFKTGKAFVRHLKSLMKK